MRVSFKIFSILTIHVPLWFTIISVVFLYLTVNYHFQVSYNNNNNNNNVIYIFFNTSYEYYNIFG